MTWIFFLLTDSSLPDFIEVRAAELVKLDSNGKFMEVGRLIKPGFN